MLTYIKTISLSATKAFDGGLLYIFGNYFLKLVQLFVFLLIWNSLHNQGVDLGIFTIEQLFLYSILASILSEQLNIVTPATTAFWEGSIISRYLKPLPVLVQLSAETVGSWIPKTVFFSIPVLLISIRYFNLSKYLASHGIMFLLSLSLSISLGFAFDYIFAAFVIRLRNAHYTAYSIRVALVTFLSGAVIPFDFMPYSLAKVLEVLPFGSLASAPLLILTGNGNVASIISLQVFWNIVLWPMAVTLFSKSQERMVSYGG